MLPQALGLAASIVLILVGAYKKLPDACTLSVSAILIGLTMGWAPRQILATYLRSALARDSLELAACVVLIKMLGASMQQYGLLDRMTSSLHRVLRSSKLAIMAVPALLGSLSVFGGAILSAPIVDSLGDRLGMSATRKAASNIVFRHGIFFMYPFSTTLLFASRVGGVSTFEMVKIVWPLTFIMMAGGYLRLIKASTDEREERSAPLSRSLADFVASSRPICLALALGLLFRVSLVAAMAAGLALCLVISRKHPDFSLGFLARSIDYGTVSVVIAVMVFKGFVSEMSLLPVAMDRLMRAGIPIEAVAALGVFVFAFASGTIQAGIGIALPILLTFATTYEQRLLYTCFVYMVGYTSYLVSPLHMCQVLTNRYFKAEPGNTYREYLPVPMTALLGGMLIYFMRKRIVF